jgi:putative ABC transport system permease protein
MMNPFPVMIADMRRSLSGCVAVVCVIALATALGVAISAQERALRRGSTQAAAAFDLLIGARGSPTQLVLTAVYLQPAALDLVPGRVLQQLQADAGVAYVAPIAFGDYYQRFPIVGSSTDLLTQGGKLVPMAGRVFAAQNEAVLGADVTLKLGEVFSPVHGQPMALADAEMHVHGAFTYVVVGRMPRLGNPWDRAIIVPVEAVWQVHGLPAGHAEAANHQHALDPTQTRLGPPWDGEDSAGVPAIVVKPKSVTDAYRLRNAYRAHAATMALFPAEVLIELYAVLGDVRALFAVLSLGTQALVVAAVLLAVLASLVSRRQQFAVLRALGASRSYIFATVWFQVSVLLCLGALCGLFLGWLGAHGLAWVFCRHTGIVLPVAITWQEMRLLLALVGVGLLLAVFPAWSSYRQPVTVALKS